MMKIPAKTTGIWVIALGGNPVPIARFKRKADKSTAIDAKIMRVVLFLFKIAPTMIAMRGITTNGNEFIPNAALKVKYDLMKENKLLIT
jgi:hypothetical protein